MTIKSKRTMTSIVSSLLIIASYLIYNFGNIAPQPERLSGWATRMLIFVGIGVVAQIIIQILFHILMTIDIAVKEHDGDEKKAERMLSSSMYEDEMDKLIQLKSTRMGYFCVSVGFLAALVAIALGIESIYALHIVIGSFAFGTIVEGAVAVYFYERGIRNG